MRLIVNEAQCNVSISWQKDESYWDFKFVVKLVSEDLALTCSSTAILSVHRDSSSSVLKSAFCDIFSLFFFKGTLAFFYEILFLASVLQLFLYAKKEVVWRCLKDQVKLFSIPGEKKSSHFKTFLALSRVLHRFE